MTEAGKVFYNDNVGQMNKKREAEIIQKANMTQIAHECGVSLKTVSRVLNHPEQVSPKTREIVESAMEQFGFQINLLAKGLKQKRTNIIMVFLDKHNGEYMNSWRNVMVRYLFRCTSEIGLKIVVAPSDSRNFMEDETDGFNLLSCGIADGAILFEYVEQDPRLEYLKKTGTPFVVLAQPREKELPAVSLDNYDIGLKGGTYLREKGYKNICFFANDGLYYSTQLRVKGFLEAVPDGKVIYGIRDVKSAYEKAGELFRTDKPDCIFTNGEDRFLGVYRAAAECGLSIPVDLAVLSSDNLPINEAAFPSLSSLGQDFDRIARECISLLQALLEKKGGEKARQIFLPSFMIERESTTILRCPDRGRMEKV